MPKPLLDSPSSNITSREYAPSEAIVMVLFSVGKIQASIVKVETSNGEGGGITAAGQAVVQIGSCRANASTPSRPN